MLLEFVLDLVASVTLAVFMAGVFGSIQVAREMWRDRKRK